MWEASKMENIILSLLLLRSMTIYEMRAFIQKNLEFVCSDSLGSLQSAIKKLLENECIIICEHEEKGILKKEYQITEKGVKRFKSWIEVPMVLKKMKNMEEGKFFFLGMAAKEKRIATLKEYIENLGAEKEKLLAIEKGIEAIKDNVIQMNVERMSKEEHLEKYLLSVSGEATLEAVVKNIFDYQIYNLQYGLKRIEDDILFYETIVEKEMSNKK